MKIKHQRITKDKNKRSSRPKGFIQVADNFLNEIVKVNSPKDLTWVAAASASSIDPMIRKPLQI